jgi:hypothetical protein
MAKKNYESKLSVTVNLNYVPFDFANLLSNEQIIQVFQEYGIEVSEQDSTSIKSFLQQWLEVLYLQYKRTNCLNNEQKESDVILPCEFRRAS